jgi:hypothetical protein
MRYKTIITMVSNAQANFTRLVGLAIRLFPKHPVYIFRARYPVRKWRQPGQQEKQNVKRQQQVMRPESWYLSDGNTHR